MTKVKAGARAAVYLRISDDKTGEELGVTRQREDTEQLCAQRGWIPVRYEDNDISAKDANKRPEFKRMLADIEAGDIHAVVAWSLDRLARNPRDRLAMVEACRDHGVLVTLVKGSDMDAATASGRFAIGVLGEAAQMEIDLKSERQTRAARQRAEAGKPSTPCRWFGYTMPNKDGTGMEVVADEADLLRAAYQGVLAGRSITGMLREWDANGVKTVKGNKWGHKSLRDTLLNARNAGIRVYRDKEIGKGNWPAIVDEDVYRGVVAILTDKTRTQVPVNGYGRHYLLSGIAVCGKCRNRLTGTAKRRTVKPRPTYVCKACQGTVRAVADVDAWVIGHVVEYLSRPETIGLTAAADRPELAELRLRKKALTERQAALRAALSDPDMPLDEVKAAAADIKAKLAEINAALSDANNARVFAGVLPDDDEAEQFYALPDEERLAIAEKRFDALTDDRKRAVIDKLVSVTVLQGQPSRGSFRPEFVTVEPKAALAAPTEGIK